MNRRALGKTLDELLGKIAEKEAGRVRQIPCSDIRRNPLQPRQKIDQKALDELAESIEEQGILQPLVVREKGTFYELIVGERRWLAAKKIGLASVPAIVRSASDEEMLQLALVENLQREDINPLEAGQAYELLIESFNMTQDELARAVGKSRTAISNTLRLLQLSEEVREALARNKISEGHGRALLPLGDSEETSRILRRIQRRGLSVRQTEVLVKKVLQKGEAPSLGLREFPDANILDLEEQVREKLGTTVKIKHSSKSGIGSIEIRYFSSEQLEEICGRLLKADNPKEAPLPECQPNL